MPFASKAQRAYLFMHHPKVAQEFADKTTHKQEMELPGHVQKMADGGHVCMACGGRVTETGEAEFKESDNETEQEEASDDLEMSAGKNYVGGR